MPVSRRSFISTIGAGSAGLLGAPLITWRGHEALFGLQGKAGQTTQAGQDARRADRLLASQPGMIRIDSNENPNGPGQHVFDTISRHLSDSNRYPVKQEDDLIAVIAKIHGISPSN